MQILALALLFALQDDKPQQADPLAWKILDGVIAQAGDAVILKSDLDQRAIAIIESQGYTMAQLSQADREQVLGYGLGHLMMSEFKVQAGEDLDIPLDDVSRLIRAAQRNQRTDQGLVEFTEDLREMQGNAIDWELRQRRGFFMNAWQQNRLGRRGYGTERPRREEFLRPGMVYAIYQSEKESGENATQVQFQDLHIPVRPELGVEETRKFAEEFRQLLLSGEEEFDFHASQPQFNPQDLLATKGVSELYSPAGLEDPVVKRFAREARVGEIHAPIPLYAKGKPRTDENIMFFKLMKLYQRIDGEVTPPLSDRAYQLELRETIGQREQNVIIDLNQRALFGRSYRWTAKGVVPPRLPDPRP